MKKIALIGLLCLMTFTLTGCKKFTYNFELDDKGNLTVYETEAINVAALESIPGAVNGFQESIAEVSNELKSSGYEVKDYDDGIHKGLTKFKKSKNITEYKNKDLPAGFTALQAMPVVMDKAFMKNKYTIKWSYELAKALEASGNSEANYSDAPIPTQAFPESSNPSLDSETSFDAPENEVIKDSFAKTLAPIAELTIALPQKARSTNAKSFIVDGKKHTYKWDLSSMENPTNIELVYEKVDYSGTIMVMSFIFLLIGLVVVMIKMKDESSF